MKIFTRFLDKLFFAAGVLLFLQLPNFVDHYTQRFGGYYDAKVEQLGAYQNIADKHFDGDLEKMAQNFSEEDNNDAIKETGAEMQKQAKEVDRLSEGKAILENGSLLRKVFYILFKPNMKVLSGTFNNYVPGTPFTTEALFSGLAGGLIFTGLFNLLMQSRYVFRRKRQKP